MLRGLLALAIAVVAVAQAPDAASFDARLTIHTIVREDIFAGFLGNDMERFAEGEKKLALLLSQRPQARPELLAWQGGAALYRAVRAHEAGREDEFDGHYTRALALFDEAVRLSPANGGVQAVTGGSYITLADRLPERYRAKAWEASYTAFNALWKAQADRVEKFPVHLKGELLAGLAQSAQRTGRPSEASEHLQRLISQLPNTPYETRAKRWKESPEIAGRSSLACQTCHEPGRLAAKTAELAKQD